MPPHCWEGLVSLKGKAMQINFITQRVMRVLNKDGSHILCNARTREEPENEAHVCTTMMWKGKSLTMSRKDILGSPRERKTEQDEARSVWEPGAISTYLHLNPHLMPNFSSGTCSSLMSSQSPAELAWLGSSGPAQGTPVNRSENTIKYPAQHPTALLTLLVSAHSKTHRWLQTAPAYTKSA